MEEFQDTTKGLILIYASSNPHLRVNYHIKCDKVAKFTNIPGNKIELVNVLRSLADKIEAQYPESKPDTKPFSPADHPLRRKHTTFCQAPIGKPCTCHEKHTLVTEKDKE